MTDRNRGEPALTLEDLRRQAQVFDLLTEAVYVLDENLNVIFANRAAHQMLGFSQEELLSRNLVDFVDPVRGAPIDRKRSQLKTEGALSFESCHLHKNGSAIPVDVRVRLITLNSRSLSISVVRDITERKTAERALVEREERFRLLFERTPIPYQSLDSDGHIIEVNRAWLETLGYTQDEVLGRWFGDFLPMEMQGLFRERFPCFKEAGSFQGFEFDMLRKDGAVLTVSFDGKIGYDADGRFQQTHCIFLDITELKRAEADRKEQYEQLRVIFETSQSGIILVDPAGTIMFANERMAEMFGCSVSELTGSTYTEHVHPEEKAAGDEKMRRLIRGEIDSVAVERHYVRRDGTDFWGFLSGRRLLNPDGSLKALVGIISDVTEKRYAEKALLAAERQFRDLLESIQLAAVILDLNGSITYCNAFLLDLTGWRQDDVLGRNWFDIFIPEDQRSAVKDVFRANVTERQRLHHENPILTRDGALRLVVWDIAVLYDANGLVSGTASIGIDVTEHRKVEAQLRQAQKMEAIGHLAGGVAHDFNNILSAIIGYASLTQMKMNTSDPLRSNLDHILSSAERAANLTHSLLAFSRKQVIDPKPAHINEIVLGVEKMLNRIIGEDIEIRVVPAPGDLMVTVDRSQIEQVLMNLATNARDAMPGGGLLTIAVEAFEIRDDFVHMHEYGKAGKYARISVSDTGTGMDQRTLTQIFEPFFTTKEVGKGTGLGLAMVYGTIKQHDGFINVYSEEGKGTTFRIYLPLTAGTVEQPSDRLRPYMPKGSGTILLVEDDNDVRSIIRTFLTEHGYTVCEARDGEEALRTFTGHKDGIDLVISDVIMPKKHGKDLFDEIQKLRPDMKFLFMSGYSADIISAKGILDEGTKFIQKPIDPGDLLRTISDILQQ